MNITTLKQLGQPLLSRFLARFEDDLTACRLSVPGDHDWIDQDFTALEKLFSSPDLPPSLAEGFTAVEQLARPENRWKLDQRVFHSPPCLRIDPDSLPLCQALQLWLWNPYQPISPQSTHSGEPTQAMDSTSCTPQSELPAPNSSQLHPTPVNQTNGDHRVHSPSFSNLTVQPQIRTASTQLQSTPVNQTENHADKCVPFPSTPQQSEPTNYPQSTPHFATRVLNLGRPSCGTLGESSDSPFFEPHRRRRNGKVAHLPKAVRDQINQMLLDGLEYAEIIKSLGEHGEGLLEKSIGSWKAGGHQDWLREQEKLEANRRKIEFALDLLANIDPGDISKIHQAVLHVSAVNLVQLMVDLDPTVLRPALESDPDKYSRLLCAIAKLSDGAVRCERHRTDEAERQAKIAKDKAIAERKGGISPEALKAAQEALRLM